MEEEISAKAEESADGNNEVELGGLGNEMLLATQTLDAMATLHPTKKLHANSFSCNWKVNLNPCQPERACWKKELKLFQL